MRFHLEQETETNLREGMAPEEARRRAVLPFDGAEGHKEAMREGRTLAWASGMMLDAKIAARMLLKQPGLTAVAISEFLFQPAEVLKG